MIEERYQLALHRISQIPNEKNMTAPAFEDYFRRAAQWILQLAGLKSFLKDGGFEKASLEELGTRNRALYEEILPGHYENSYACYAYAEDRLGSRHGKLLCALYYELRTMIPFVFENETERMLIRMELFLEIYHMFTARFAEAQADPDTDEIPDHLHIRDRIYDFLTDYAEAETLCEVREKLVGGTGIAEGIIREADLSDLRYLYRYGEYITENELRTARHLNAMAPEEIARMADTYTEGYRIGFEVTGKDLSIKKQYSIIYHLGFERMMRRALQNFDRMGLTCAAPRTMETLFRLSRGDHSGYRGAVPNPQCSYDHREDIALFLNGFMRNRRLEALEAAYKQLHAQTVLFAGPAVVETFGETPFSPVRNAGVPVLNRRQRKEMAEYRRKSSALQQEAIRGWERSFTVIAFPLPSVSPDRYEEIFDAVMEINTLDYMKYSRIQTALIDALNDADHVRVKGRYPNRTDLTVKLRQLEDPDRQAVFENCVADINIPVGEVFTSPVLEGTNGLLHVSKVYLEGLQYTDLAIRFKEGMTESYSCGNFADPAEGRKYIEDNILFHYPSLPMGECAIGTNTTAFAAARRYHIEALLPILIAEKTGPHFAVGDTCYAHDEDNRMFNPDGKEIVAKDNSWSARRKEDPEGAYFGCHTDITLPYDELAEFKAVYRDGREVMIIRDGRFVLPGTEELNVPLDRMEETE